MSAPAIRTRGLRKVYGNVLALDSLDLEVPAGSIFGLVGPNGAGKTTTFSVVMGFVRPDAGTVEVLGRPITDRAALRCRVLGLPQDALLDGRVSVLRSLTHLARLAGMERGAAENEAHSVLERMGLLDRADARPTELSHGMAKKVGVAQALMGSADLLLLDEPTAGLDPRAAAELRALVREVRGERAVVISSHNLAEIQEICDHVAIIDRGRAVDAGSIDELTRADAVVEIDVREGAVPLAQLREIGGVSDVAGEGPGTVSIHFDPGAAPADDVISAALSVLLGAGCKVGEVRKGKGLEARYLETT